jgi:hypothetical protein
MAKTKKKIDPLRQHFISDAVANESLDNLGKRYEEKLDDPDLNFLEQWLASSAGANRLAGQRFARGSARVSESFPWQAALMLDPTPIDMLQIPGVASFASTVGGNKKTVNKQKSKAKRDYKKFIKKHQAKLDKGAVPTSKDSVYHQALQRIIASRDSNIAGYDYSRKEDPYGYWLNPFNLTARTGPVLDVLRRYERRVAAGLGSPESTAGRAAMGLGGVGTLGLLPAYRGDEKEQQRLRAAAVKNKLYAGVAEPEEKEQEIEKESSIRQLARLAANVV